MGEGAQARCRAHAAIRGCSSPLPGIQGGGTQPRFADCIAPQAYTADPLFYLLKPVNCPVGLVPRCKLVLLHVPGGVVVAICPVLACRT